MQVLFKDEVWLVRKAFGTKKILFPFYSGDCPVGEPNQQRTLNRLPPELRCRNFVNARTDRARQSAPKHAKKKKSARDVHAFRPSLPLCTPPAGGRVGAPAPPVCGCSLTVRWPWPSPCPPGPPWRARSPRSGTCRPSSRSRRRPGGTGCPVGGSGGW